MLEASFFPAILSPLTIVYRCKNYRDEVAIAKNMCQHVNASPRDLSVRKKYWLLKQVANGVGRFGGLHQGREVWWSPSGQGGLVVFIRAGRFGGLHQDRKV